MTLGAECGSAVAGVWIANTVGLCNYKAFLLFLFYTFWACLLAAAMLLSEVVHFFKGLDTIGPEKSSRHASLLGPQAHSLFLECLMQALF